MEEKNTLERLSSQWNWPHEGSRANCRRQWRESDYSLDIDWWPKVMKLSPKWPSNPKNIMLIGGFSIFRLIELVISKVQTENMTFGLILPKEEHMWDNYPSCGILI